MHSRLICLAASLMQVSGMGRLIGRHHAGTGAIFMLHSVVRGDAEFIHPFMQVRDTFLDAILGDLVSAGVELISLNAALQRLEQGVDRPFACFTLDDGYRDNLTVALPVFQRWNCPLTIYVTTALVERRMPYEWGCLRELVASNDKLDVEVLGVRLSTVTQREKNHSFNKLHRMTVSGVLSASACDDLFQRYGICATNLQDRDALNVSELLVLARSPLVEIGGHTDTHRRLAELSIDDARADMRRNKEFLETLLERPAKHFAFPYGDAASCGPREFLLAKEVGFVTATTTRIGGLFSRHLAASNAWPRLHFRGSLESRDFMESQRNGAVAALLSWVRRSEAINGLAI